MRKLASIAITTLLVYYEIYRWMPLGRWNWQFSMPVQNDQFYPDIVIGILLATFTWCFASNRRIGMLLASTLLTLWAVVHAFDWWIPYANDLPQNAGRYSFYQPHTQLLPVIGHHYPPDAGHAILDFILYPTVCLAIAATIRSVRRGR